MSKRCFEPGWTLEIRDGSRGRRGIWSRRSDGLLELCAGNEGDDVYLRLQVGEPITPELHKTLREVLAHGRGTNTYDAGWEPEE